MRLTLTMRQTVHSLAALVAVDPIHRNRVLRSRTKNRLPPSSDGPSLMRRPPTFRLCQRHKSFGSIDSCRKVHLSTYREMISPAPKRGNAIGLPKAGTLLAISSSPFWRSATLHESRRKRRHLGQSLVIKYPLENEHSRRYGGLSIILRFRRFWRFGMVHTWQCIPWSLPCGADSASAPLIIRLFSRRSRNDAWSCYAGCWPLYVLQHCIIKAIGGLLLDVLLFQKR